MDKIQNVLICGLGAIGGYYASVIADYSEINLKILVDNERLNKYKLEPRIVNNKTIKFDYILPNNTQFRTDLIIIATKSSGLDETINNISNFVDNNTIILSFLNGISSEKLIKNKYKQAKILNSFLIGHTFFRSGRYINHDGNAKIVFGAVDSNEDEVTLVNNFFNKLNIPHEISNNILKSQWEKFCFNCCVNQISAITRMTFGEIKKSEKCLNLIKNICFEITEIAKNEGILSDFYSKTLEYLDKMLPDGKTSMLQDIENGIKPEIDIFGETIVELGKKYSIEVPYNKVITEIIETF